MFGESAREAKGTNVSIPSCTRGRQFQAMISVFSGRFVYSTILVGAIVMAANLRYARPSEPGYSNSTSAEELSPTALVATADGQTLYIAYATADKIAVFNVSQGRVTKTIPVPASPTGLALARDGTRLYVTCAAPLSTACIIDTVKETYIDKIRTGYFSMAPVLSPDGRTLYVCNRFSNTISVINLATLREQKLIPVDREPVAEAITKDGKFLLVANHLQSGRADQSYVAAKISVIRLADEKVSGEIRLPNGSTMLRDIQISPDGRYACVTHQIDRFRLPTTQLDRGWVMTNAMSLIDLSKMKLINTVLLDDIDRGAANPWAITWSADGKYICVTSAGTNEVSVIDWAAVLFKVNKIPTEEGSNQDIGSNSVLASAAGVPNDLSFLVGLRKRIMLGNERGSRAILSIGDRIYTANYFSDSLSEINLSDAVPIARTIQLAPTEPVSTARMGEMWFNDASLSFQGWLSCSSCHDDDAMGDGMNWDLPNDGIGNPKNTKSLLGAFDMSPVTWLGVRKNAEVDVQAGFRFILFAGHQQAAVLAVDAYIQSLRPMPSPYLNDGRLSKAELRGKKIFDDKNVGCSTCHTGKLLTDQKRHDVGTRDKYDDTHDRFITPSLIEGWLTAPYLHDGSAATLGDVLTTCNKSDRHGKTSQLTDDEVHDLVMYLRSL